jgi:hypothetical protein
MADATQTVPLRDALRMMLRHPLTLMREWNWKAAVFSALLRGLLFFFTNLHAGRARAGKAMLVELVYATVAAGIAGAVTQRLRHTVPRAATAGVVWLAIPALMLSAQALVHHAMGTPRLRASLLASFVFAAFATGFNWFAMSRGAFVTGEGRSFARDLLLVPRLLLQFAASLIGSNSSAPRSH